MDGSSGPLVSRPALENLKQLPGVWIPEEVEKRLRGTPQGRMEAQGLALCSEIIEDLRDVPGVAEVLIIVANREERMPEILQGAGLGPRDNRGSPPVISGRSPDRAGMPWPAIALGERF